MPNTRTANKGRPGLKQDRYSMMTVHLIQQLHWQLRRRPRTGSRPLIRPLHRIHRPLHRIHRGPLPHHGQKVLQRLRLRHGLRHRTLHPPKQAVSA